MRFFAMLRITKGCCSLLHWFLSSH
jgi:hypothetical protein